MQDKTDLKDEVHAGLLNSLELKRDLDADAEVYLNGCRDDIGYFNGLSGEAAGAAKDLVKAAWVLGFCGDGEIGKLVGEVSEAYGIEMFSQSYGRKLSERQADLLYGMLSACCDGRMLGVSTANGQRPVDKRFLKIYTQNHIKEAIDAGMGDLLIVQEMAGVHGMSGYLKKAAQC